MPVHFLSDLYGSRYIRLAVANFTFSSCHNLIQVVIARGFHLFPFRTEKLSLVTPMVLRNSGRVGSRRFLKSPLDSLRVKGISVFIHLYRFSITFQNNIPPFKMVGYFLILYYHTVCLLFSKSVLYICIPFFGTPLALSLANNQNY